MIKFTSASTSKRTSKRYWCRCDASLVLKSSSHLMVLLEDEAELEARFCLFRDSANLDVISVHGLCQTYHGLRNHF
jgi:hypothetical protein